MIAMKIGDMDIPREIIASIQITRKGSIQQQIDAEIGTIKIDVLSMHYYEKFQELFTQRKSYNDTIVRQVAIGVHVIRHNFKFTSTAHVGIPNETANEIQITLESVE